MIPPTHGNILTVDLEEHFMVSAFEGVVKREEWGKYESRIDRNTVRLLGILNHSYPPLPWALHPAPAACRATFFCLGCVAERHPGLIQEIHSQGHEIASHGYDHRMITTMSPKAFREDVRKSKGILEDLIGEKILGYRAPSYSITRQTLWALEILAEEGYLYDSSVFPVHHDRYGFPQAPRLPFLCSTNGGPDGKLSTLDGPCVSPLGEKKLMSLSRNQLIEFPLSTVRFLGNNLPVGGGGYFRLYPLWFTLWGLKRIERKDRTPFVFYLHPWEIDPDQPRIKGIPLKSRFRHYLHLHKTEGRLLRILRTFPFDSFRGFLQRFQISGKGILPATHFGRNPSADARSSGPGRIQKSDCHK